MQLFYQSNIFFAWCAEHGLYPGKADMVMAYLQAKICDQVFIKLPDFWKYLLPKEYHRCIDHPLCLLKALYDYTFSGKFLYEEQADFLREKDFVPVNQ